MSSPYGPPDGWSPQPGSYGQAYPVARSTNGMAVASLVTSLVGFAFTGGALGVVGAILGHVALGQIRRTGEGGRGMALAGIIVGWVTFALLLIGIALFITFFVVLATSTSP